MAPLNKSGFPVPQLSVPSATGISRREETRGFKEWADERILTVKDQDLQKCASFQWLPQSTFKQTASWGWVVGTWASVTKTSEAPEASIHTLPSLENKPVLKTTTSFLKELTLSDS